MLEVFAVFCALNNPASCNDVTLVPLIEDPGPYVCTRAAQAMAAKYLYEHADKKLSVARYGCRRPATTAKA